MMIYMRSVVSLTATTPGMTCACQWMAWHGMCGSVDGMTCAGRWMAWHGMCGSVEGMAWHVWVSGGHGMERESAPRLASGMV